MITENGGTNKRVPTCFDSHNQRGVVNIKHTNNYFVNRIKNMKEQDKDHKTKYYKYTDR